MIYAGFVARLIILAKKGKTMNQDPIVGDSAIGAAIRRRRIQLKLSPEELGSMLNISRQQMQRYENGSSSLNVDKLQEVAHALSVPICYFFIADPARKVVLPVECNIARIVARQVTINNSPAFRLEYQQKQDPILLIDDDEQAGVMTKLVLGSEGYRNFHVLRDSRLVIPFLKETEVALVLLDLLMPHITGDELLPILRSDFPQIQVIIMTAVDDQKTQEQCLNLGVSDYLVKPVYPEHLVSAVEHAIARIKGLQ